MLRTEMIAQLESILNSTSTSGRMVLQNVIQALKGVPEETAKHYETHHSPEPEEKAVEEKPVKKAKRGRPHKV